MRRRQNNTVWPIHPLWDSVWPNGAGPRAAGRNSGENRNRPSGNGESKVAPSAYAKEPDIVYHHYTLLEINPAYVEKVESQPCGKAMFAA